MAIQIVETWDSRKIQIDPQTPRATLKYFLVGTDDHDEAFAALVAEAPTDFESLPRITINLDPLGGLCWSGTVTYEFPEGLLSPTIEPTLFSPLDVGCSLSVSASTQRRLTSFKTKFQKGINGIAPPNFQGSINVTQDGKVQGVDVYTPTLTLTVSRIREVVTMSYVATCAALVGKINDRTWWGLDDGQVLFLGCEAQPRQVTADNPRGFALTYKFEISYTQKPGDIGEMKNLPEKRGWDYLWVLFAPKTDTTTDPEHQVEVPVACYYEEVFKGTNLAILGL